MSYSMQMGEEKKLTRKRLLPEGWRSFKINSCNEMTSKSNNKMFKLEIEDKETGYADSIYLVAEPKKRWMLKNLLSCCGVEAANDGVYNWKIEDVIGKSVLGLIEHEDQEYINRNGDAVKAKQHRIVEFKQEGETKAWDDDIK